jgi:acetyl-CoA acyltransferase
MPPKWTVSLGESNEQLREKFNIARERPDAFAYRSHRLADQAWQDGFYDDIVTSVPEIVLARDEGIRSDTTPEKLAALKPSFRPDGTITAGNASPLNDGASALLMGSDSGRRRTNPRHIAKVLHGGGYRWGVAAICIGVGQGLAVVRENLNTTRRAA